MNELNTFSKTERYQADECCYSDLLDCESTGGFLEQVSDLLNGSISTGIAQIGKGSQFREFLDRLSKASADEQRLAQAEKGLEQQIKGAIPVKDHEQFMSHLKEFEKRATKEGIKPGEVADTLNHICRLLKERGDGVVTDSERKVLAQQIIKQCARPYDIDQGYHDTCSVTTLEVRLYARNPANAAKQVTDLALTGTLTTVSGRKVVIDNGSRRPDREAKLHPTPDGLRSFASQLLQVGMVNTYYSKADPKTIYRQTENVDRKTKETGEQLADKKTGLVFGYNPALDGDRMDRIYGELSAERNAPYMFSGRNEGSHTVLVASVKDLKAQLQNLKEDRNLPGVACFNSDLLKKYYEIGPSALEGIPENHAKAAERSKGVFASNSIPVLNEEKEPPHVVNVRDFYHDPKSGKHMVSISNQWGARYDIVMPIEDFYKLLCRR